MPQSHPLVRQPRNDALRPSVELGEEWLRSKELFARYACELICKFPKADFQYRSGLNGSVWSRARLDLRGARWILQRRARSGSRFVFNQQAFGLEQHLQFDNGLHRTPLVPGVLKILLHI